MFWLLINEVVLSFHLPKGECTKQERSKTVNIYWNWFEKSGSIEAYLAYRYKNGLQNPKGMEKNTPIQFILTTGEYYGSR